MEPVISILSGEVQSEVNDFVKTKIKDYKKTNKAGKALDQYNLDFQKRNDTAISDENVDFESIVKVKKKLLSKAKEHILSPYTNSNTNQKEQFVKEACEEIEDCSEITKKYLSGFYDLAFAKETEDASDSEKALINFLADQFNISIHEIKNEIVGLKQTVGVLTNKESDTVDFSNYYNYVKNRFTRKKNPEETLVGSYSDSEAYIDAYIKYRNKSISIFKYLEEWFCRDAYGSLLIHGEPGHGKTTLCNKAIFDYCEGRFLKDKATNVLSVSLNTGYNHGIVNNGVFDIDKVLVLGRYKKQFHFDDCRGALLFMDGFDEFIDEAKKADIPDIVSFMKIIDDVAEFYNLHIVVLSRTIVVKNYLRESGIAGKNYELSPLSYDQQQKWLSMHCEYSAYEGTFNKIRSNMQELLEIPFLFRLIVHNRFSETGTTVVELYDKLIIHLLNNRGIHGEELESAITKLEEFSYRIYCDDTDTAIITDSERDHRWMIAFYVKLFNKHRIGFFHRSFYQYFLAKNIYSGILDINNIGGENFIGRFAERELDETVCQYLSMINKNNDQKKAIHSNLKLVVEALVKTEAYPDSERRCTDGNAEETKLGRTINIYRNILHICAAFSFVIQIPFKDKIDVFLRTYPSYRINIHSDLTQRADLKLADLHLANLNEANLKGANLTKAELWETYLRKANLREADLLGANLTGANLSGADLYQANLTGANLTRANLSGANLRGAKLDKAILREANLNGADLSGAGLYEANLSYAILKGTNLNKAFLRDAYLNEVDLRDSNLTEAFLSGVFLKPTHVANMIIEYSNEVYVDPSVYGYKLIKWVKNTSW